MALFPGSRGSGILPPPARPMLRGLFGEKALGIRPRPLISSLRHIGQIGVAENRKAFLANNTTGAPHSAAFSDHSPGAAGLAATSALIICIGCNCFCMSVISPRRPCIKSAVKIDVGLFSSRR